MTTENNMNYDESIGKGDHNLYIKGIQAFSKIEKDDRCSYPKDFDASCVFSIRRLFHLTEDTFSLKALEYGKALPDKIIDLLAGSARLINSKRPADLVKNDQPYSGICKREIEAYSEHIHGEKLNSLGIVLIQGGVYFLA